MLSTYDPEKVVINFGGHNIDGYAKGEFIKIARNADTWVLETGSDNRSIRTKIGDQSGRIDITLLQSSISNDVLSGFATIDELTGNGAAPMTVKDLRGTSLYTCPFAYILKPADGTFSNANTNRVWSFICIKLKMVTGGIPYNI